MDSNAAIELEAKIHRGIPLSQAMGFRITRLREQEISVSAPLTPNRNIHGTGFAGSLYGLGILTAWGLCAQIIARAGLDGDLVVAEASIRYRAPVRGEITCHCSIADDAARAFLDDLAARRRARVSLEVAIGEGPAAVISARMHASRTL
jgi:thioesterase domain-containing protein